MTSTAEVIKEFASITGANADTSRFYLESSGWDIGAATEMFFESGGQPVSAAAAGAPPPAAGRAASPQAPRPAQSQPKRGGGIRGFSDLGADEEEGKKQNYYTGGKSSGMMVEDPQGPPSGSSNDIVSQLMENARRSGGQTAPPEEPAPAPSRPVFTGAGFRLGDETRPSERVAPKAEAAPTQEANGPLTYTLEFYRQGFTVNKGPLRSYTDPENSTFLADINQGIAPVELQEAAGGRQLSVDLVDKKSEDYVPPPKVIVPFAGSGQRLGGPSTSTAPTPATTTSSAPRRALTIDETKPTTSVQIRLHDGTRLVAKFNHTHTVGDLRGFVDAALPKKVAYQLQTTLPVRVLADESQTLADAGLLGATVVQRPL